MNKKKKDKKPKLTQTQKMFLGSLKALMSTIVKMGF